jgi:glycosyltransferase involved in cell wall biosynthesis
LRRTSLWHDWQIRHVTTHADGSRWRKAGAFATGTLRFVVLLVRFRPQVVHLHSSADASFIRKAFLLWVSAIARVPAVMHMHGSDFQRYHDDSRRPVRAAISATLSRAAVVIALGEVWAGRLRVIAPSARVAVVPNAVRSARTVAQPRRGEPVEVVFLGRIGDRKGAFRLLEAWALLTAGGDVGSAATLTLAGDGDTALARLRVRELGVEDSVVVHEWLPEHVVGELLNRSHVLVLPSRNEGQPMAVLEAMARGMCVVSSGAGGLSEMVGGGCGLIVPPDDVDAIAAALRQAIDDPDLRRRLGSAARTRCAETFDVDAVARRIDELYRTITGASVV